MNLRFFTPFIFSFTMGICSLSQVGAIIDAHSFEIISSEDDNFDEDDNFELIDLIGNYLATDAYDDYVTFQLQFFLIKNHLAIKINEKENTVFVLAKIENGMVWSTIDWIR